ncbi:hypothetical protein [Ramlibacter sp. 2FC]|uniref:hypothetical protein n=1 Tax=Ramlibacter sp. 2FC TaxID=2502188 RepID=UPI0010F86B24|nr:hypothetical protein [Ramlibacter sp. 2FC]
MALRYLEFDYSEDTAGVGCFEAMAAVGPPQLQALHAEIVEVLGWAHAAFADRGPLEDGHDWDYELQGAQEVTAPQTLHYDEATGRLEVSVGPTGAPRHTLTLTLSGSPAFCEAFRGRFGLD